MTDVDVGADEDAVSVNDASAESAQSTGTGMFSSFVEVE